MTDSVKLMPPKQTSFIPRRASQIVTHLAVTPWWNELRPLELFSLIHTFKGLGFNQLTFFKKEKIAKQIFHCNFS